MPADSYIRIDANGDGESTWSNNPNQEDVLSVRVKGSNNFDDFKRWLQKIQAVRQEICIVDIGGRLQEDKSILFDVCDCFIVLSNDLILAKKWIEFGEKHGCKCLAMIHSQLSGVDVVLRSDPYIVAEISGLERGRRCDDSIVVRSVADKIIEESEYRQVVKLDFINVANQIGASSVRYTSTGIKVSCVNIEESHAVSLYKYFTTIYSPNVRYEISGIKVMWAACIAVTCLCKGTPDAVVFYDELENRYYSPFKIILSACPQNNLNLRLLEDGDSVLVRAHVSETYHSMLVNNQFPIVDSSKDLYVSGNFPTWFFASIQLSYSNKRMYIHRPGIGYICVKSDDVTDIGTVSTKFVGVNLLT